MSGWAAYELVDLASGAVRDAVSPLLPQPHLAFLGGKAVLTVATETAPQRAPLLAAALATFGLFCVFLAWSGLTETFSGFAARSPLVRVRTGAATAAPVSVMLLLFALMLIRRPSADGRREKLLFGTVLACAPLLVIMPVALGLGMGAALGGRDYRQCEGPMGSRGFLTRIWIRDDAPCPSSP